MAIEMFNKIEPTEECLLIKESKKEFQRLVQEAKIISFIQKKIDERPEMIKEESDPLSSIKETIDKIKGLIDLLKKQIDDL